MYVCATGAMEYTVRLVRVSLGLILLGLAVCSHANQTDHGIILTGVPFYFSGYKHLVAITTSPRELDNNTETFKGYDFNDINVLPVSCDTDYDRHHLYYYDYGSRGISLLENFTTEMDIDSVNKSQFQAAASKGFTMVAVDWVNHNVYWTEPMLGRIMIKKGGRNNDTTAHYVILNNLKRPRGLAVDPFAGYIFWTDIETKTIGRASLIGRNSINLIYGKMQIPDSIVLDRPMKKLYWTDKDSIYSATYEGKERQHFYRYSYAFFYDIALFEDVLVITDVEKFFLFFIDKTTGKEVATRYKSSTEAYYGVCTYQNRTEASPDQKDECEGYGCEEICVKQPGKEKPTCLCRDGFLLTGDGKTCRPNGYPYYRGIVLNTGDQLCIVNIQILSDHKEANTTCFYSAPANKTITHFDLNMQDREVYFSIERTIYSVNIDTVSQNDRKIVTQNYDILGLTYDWADRQIYYILTSKAGVQQPESVWRVSPYSRSTVPTQLETGPAPRAIAISPHERKIFWITGNETDARVEYTDLSLPKSGTTINIIETTSYINNVTHMYHDVKTESLYLLERWPNVNYVIKMEYDGNFTKYLTVTNGISDFAVYKDYIITGFKEGRADENVTLQTVDLSQAPILDVVASGKLDGIKQLVGIKVLDKEVLQPAYPDPCGSVTKNGGCDQICLPEGNQYSCLCNLGYTLINDKECKSYPVKDNFMLISDITFNEIFQVPLNDPTNVIAIKTVSRGRPNGVFYNYDTETIMWASDDYRQIWGVSLNGTVDSSLITRTGYRSPDRIAYDPSSRLLYYSSSSLFPVNGYRGFIYAIDTEGRESKVHGVADSPRAIVLHPRKGLMFYTDHGNKPGIFKMEMNGANLTAIIEEDIVWPNGMTIDYDAERLYWADGYLDKIFSCDFEGQDRITIYEEADTHMMALKLLDGYLYFSAWDKSKVTKVKIDNTSDITLIGPDHGLGRVHAMDIYVSGKTDNIPDNLGCSSNNGGCSHFCFPTTAGYECGCETGFSLLRGGKTCENVPRCPGDVENGVINHTDDCLRLAGQMCTFICDKNYRAKPGTNFIKCTTESNPDSLEDLLWDNNDPCEEIFCPMEIENGQLDRLCDRRVDSNCVNYTCNAGYEKNPEITSLVCQGWGVWKLQGDLCIPKCPVVSSMADNAFLHPTCNRDIGESCKFFCDDGYKMAVTYDRVKCESGSQWNVTTRTLCQEIMCKDYIEGGVVNETCSLKLGSVCEYACDFRFQPNPSIINVTCVREGDWSHGGSETDLLCTEIAVETAAAQTDNKVAIGAGVSVGVLVLVVIIVLVLVFLYRSGRLPTLKKEPIDSTTSFENPRYVGDNVNIQPTGSEHTYIGLEDDRVDLTKESWRRTQEQMKSSSEHVYDNPTEISQPR